MSATQRSPREVWFGEGRTAGGVTLYARWIRACDSETRRQRCHQTAIRKKAAGITSPAALGRMQNQFSAKSQTRQEPMCMLFNATQHGQRFL